MTEDEKAAEHKAIERVINRLTEAFAAQLSGGDIAQAVQDAYRGFEGSKVRDFVPLLVENAARRRLSDPSRRVHASTQTVSTYGG